MDQGPIDAGPHATGGYDQPAGSSYSPEQRFSRPHSPVGRRSGLHDQDSESFDFATSSKRSSNSLEDPPLYPRVGATAEDLRRGSIIDNYEPADKVGGATDGQADGAADGATNAPEQGKKEPTSHRMHKFTLYETNVRYWITGADVTDTVFKLLRIDRTSAPGQISLFEDPTLYDRNQLKELLSSIDDGNKTTGGLRYKRVFWGLLGFIRFTEAYYMLIITKRQQCAMIGGHYIYQVEGTELVPLTTGSSSRFMSNRNPEEGRFLGILNNLDLSKSFYFSYSYNITRSLQHNIIRQRTALNEGRHCDSHDFSSMFVWNHHLLKPARNTLENPFDWCVPIIHGFIDQAALDVFGRAVYITVIGRRSRFFAGARFLKRGINDLGYVANDVETEQIVSEMLTTSFHAPGPRLFANPTWTSYVHHRGSIPLYWTQDNSGVTPKPNIDLNLQDPFYQPAALHFDNLFERYGCPIYVLNLIKSRERTPRESKLLHEFANCLDYLNLSLPEDKKIIYKAFDMSRASKTRGGDVIGNLEIIAEEIVNATGFFHNGDPEHDNPQVQNGVARTNCIDCLDRTNAAQFVIGKRAFGTQLHALGVLNSHEVDYDTNAVNIFTHMFHDHGDTIAVQYGGSHLVNTMATYRKLNQWQSHSRDMVESFKRYYHNSFLDNQRQEAYNLFLGNYIWAQGQPMLWDLVTDYYLHHSDPRAYLERRRRHYFHWYTPAFLEPRTLPPTLYASPFPPRDPTSPISPTSPYPISSLQTHDDYWLEYYRPQTLTSFLKLYSYRMNSSSRHLPDRAPPPPRPSTASDQSQQTKNFDFSPFKPHPDPSRAGTPQQHLDPTDPAASKSKPLRIKPKGVTIVSPSDPPVSPARPPTATSAVDPGAQEHPSILREPSTHTPSHPTPSIAPQASPQIRPLDRKTSHTWTLNDFHTQSLHPSLTPAETAEYRRYITHPLSLPLVTGSETAHTGDVGGEYVAYLLRGTGTFPPHHRAGSVHSLHSLHSPHERSEREPSHHLPGIDEEGFEDVGASVRRDFEEFLSVGEREDALTVGEEDGGKKRYKAYRQWLRGKSLFKQRKFDPEFAAGGM